MSEDQEVKTNENNDYNQIDVKQKTEEQKIIVPKPFIPLIRYKKVIDYASVINYFAISISLFVFGVINLEWFKSNSNTAFYSGYFLFSGLVLYFLGVLNWYEGKELIFLIDFIYSFYFIALFMRESKTLSITEDDNNKMQGSFYVVFFCLIICITISYKNKGKIYIINYVVLFVGYLFLFFNKYIETEWGKKVYSFIFIVSGALFWITGLLKTIDNGLADTSISILQPSD